MKRGLSLIRVRPAHTTMGSDRLTPLQMLWLAAGWIGAGALLVSLSIAYVDRPVALFAHAELREPRLANALARLPETIFLVPLLAALGAAVAVVAGMHWWIVVRIGGVAITAYALGETIKTGLKYVCGRPWPETWAHNNPSFIRDGLYGFVPFHGGNGFASFPSGHMTAATAVMAVAWLMVPRWRALWALILLFCAGFLLAMNLHFVGDVVAGFFLGTAVAVGVVRLARHLRLLDLSQ